MKWSIECGENGLVVECMMKEYRGGVGGALHAYYYRYKSKRFETLDEKHRERGKKKSSAYDNRAEKREGKKDVRLILVLVQPFCVFSSFVILRQ
jgi:hypothetical protein